MILRCYGEAQVHHPNDEVFQSLASQFEPMAGSRQIFDMRIDMVQTSCGTGIPLMQFRAHRGPDELLPYYEEMGADGVRDYWKRKNVVSIDGFDTGLMANDE